MTQDKKIFQATVVAAITFLLAGFVTGWHFANLRCPKYRTETVYIQQDTVRVHLIDTLIVPVYSERIKEVPIRYYIVDSTDVASRVTAKTKIDTAAIIAEFLTKNFYDQVFVNDSTGYIRIKQTVEMNRITNQELVFVPAPIREVHVFRESMPKNFRFGAGFDYVFKHEQTDLFLKGSVLWKDRYQFGVGFSIDNWKSVNVGIVF